MDPITIAGLALLAQFASVTLQAIQPSKVNVCVHDGETQVCRLSKPTIEDVQETMRFLRAATTPQ